MKAASRKTAAVGFFAMAILTGFLLLLFLLDKGIDRDLRVPADSDGEANLEMVVVLTPIEEPEAARKTRAQRVEREWTRREQASQARAQMSQKTIPPVQEMATDQEAPAVHSAGLQESDGRYPALVASYSGESGGLRAHLMALCALGARTFLADMAKRELVAEVDPATWSLSRHFASPSGMALDRSRLIDDDANVAAIIARARAQYGHEELGFVLLMPRSIEDRILHGMDRAFQKVGRSASQFVSVRGSYEQNGGSLSLSVVDARDQAGNSVPLSAQIPLGEP